MSICTFLAHGMQPEVTPLSLETLLSSSSPWQSLSNIADLHCIAMRNSVIRIVESFVSEREAEG